MAVNWPPQLPQAPGSFNEQPKSVVVRTSTDSGPTKTRRRFTKAARTATMSFLLTIEQYAILDSFFENDCAGGAISMLFTHPWTQTVREMYITEPPNYSNDSGLGVSVSLKVEYF